MHKVHFYRQSMRKYPGRIADDIATALGKPANMTYYRRENEKWSQYEHEKYLIGTQKYGSDLQAVAAFIGSRDANQVKQYANKIFRKRLNVKTDF